MGLLNYATVDVWKEAKFRKKSRQIGDFLRGDFATIEAELAAVFPNTRGLQERYIPLVARYAHELSGMYTRPVVRRFLASELPTPELLVDLQRAYDDADVDGALAEAHRELLVQNMIALLPMPDGPSGIRLQSFAPWQIEWHTGDPMRAADIAAASSVDLLVPSDVTEGVVTYGRMHLSRTEAWREVNGQRVGLYRLDGANPLGRIPLVVMRLETPQPGRWAPPINESLLSMQIALCVSESDTELLVHTQAWGQRVIEGAQPGQQVETLQVGPDKVLALVSHDPDAVPPKLAIVQGQPPLAQITGWNESRLRLLCSMFDLSPDAFLKVNTAVTASARAADARDRAQARERVLPKFARAERELARLVAATLNLFRVRQIPQTVDVSVRYQDWEAAVDPLHESQALESSFRLGLSSPAEYVANRDGITYAEAQRRVARNLAASKAFEPAAPPPESTPEQVVGA